MSAHALNGPASIQIDGGPLGPLEMSGGMSGYFYAQSGTSDKGGNSFVGDRSTGASLDAALIDLQKNTGILQFNLEVGPEGGTTTLGNKPSKASITVYRASPIYQGYVTIAPTNSPITISAGQFLSLEGYESGVSWNNANMFLTDMFYVENGSSVGVSATYTHGPLSVDVVFGDGWDTRVMNFLQALATYTINSNNNVNVFYAGNLGKTGPNAITYGQSPVGPAPLLSPISSIRRCSGGWYSYTNGNLNLVPEVQYVYAKPDQQLGITKYTANFGAAVFSNYTFGTSPYSLGGMAEYFDSTGYSLWFIAPHAEGIGLELTPTWQYKDLYVRGSVGYMHLLNIGTIPPAKLPPMAITAPAQHRAERPRSRPGLLNLSFPRQARRDKTCRGGLFYGPPQNLLFPLQRINAASRME